MSLLSPAYNPTVLPGERTPSLEDFHQLLLIGRGATCSVYLVRHKTTGRLSSASSKAISSLPDTPCSLLLLEASWTDAEYYYFVTPWYEGKDLSAAFVNGQKFCSDRVKVYMAQLLVAVETLHRLNVIHRDLKPANIFLTKEGNVVLGDFGFSKRFRTTLMSGAEEEEPTNISFDVNPDATSGSFLVPTFEDVTCTTTDSTGTLHWMSPQQHAGLDYSFDADLWALGLLMFRMLTGRLPFNGDDANDIDKVQIAYATEEVEFRPEDGVDLCAQDLIRGLLKKDRHGRTTLAEAKAHPYFTGVNWSAAARHTGPATWAPRKAYVPQGPRKTPLTTGVPYQYGDDFPDFVFVRAGFFDPPPGPIKALVLKVGRVFGRKSKNIKAKTKIMDPPSRVPIKALEKPVFYTISLTSSAKDEMHHRYPQCQVSRSDSRSLKVARNSQWFLVSRLLSFFKATPTSSPTFIPIIRKSSRTKGSLSLQSSHPTSPCFKAGETSTQKVEAPPSIFSVIRSFFYRTPSRPRTPAHKTPNHKLASSAPSSGSRSLPGRDHKLSLGALPIEFFRRRFRFKVKCGSLKQLDLTTC
ncbi:Serine/threonine-protein kinase YPK1 [Mycena sanguinolenta]|uniref:Serine/threonine-protein kinase YPK1 n=1 Tax=Mycena sanguinolenta TaxID=230812 RepID=A0A8H6ZD24_9AGAR|nr:Serine/threonine-protein kinase YPK1 [Mycena sanguinolenta]